MADAIATPLYDLHKRYGAKIVDFAGYAMPVQYPLGVLKEHLHTRAQAGLFDVSHMGQIVITGPDAGAALERVMPQDLIDLPLNRQRYGFLTNTEGGILDDVMVTRVSDTTFHMVANAGNKAHVLAHLAHACPTCDITLNDSAGLIALQGPRAAGALSALVPTCTDLQFMDRAVLDSAFGPLDVSRSGYTGDDGFEISVAADRADPLAEALLEQSPVAPIGLGARDSLRLEAGLCLHGVDIDATTTPVDAGLAWAIQKVRRIGGARAGGFPGADRILATLQGGGVRKRVGLLPDGRAPMRAGVALYAAPDAESPIGHVTSGAYGPSIARPMSMGYVPRAHAAPGTQLYGDVRGKRLPVTVAPLPFRPATLKRSPQKESP